MWERLLELAEARMGGPALGMVFLDGTSIRAHHKAAGAQKRGWTASNEIAVKHLAALAAATAPRFVLLPTAVAGP